MLKLTEIFISLEEGFCIYLSFKLLWNGLGLKNVRENVDMARQGRWDGGQHRGLILVVR